MLKQDNHHVKNIIFDLDGTLVHRVPHRAVYIQGFLADRGIQMTKPQEIEAGHWSHQFWENPTNYEPDENDPVNPWFHFWLGYLERYYEILNLGWETLEPLFNELALRLDEDQRDETLGDDVEDVLSLLQNKGFRLGVLSNRYRPVRPVIDQFGLSAFFEAVFSAGELDSEKPEREIFIRYLDIFNGKPSETLYVGDNYWLDGIGAQNAGLHPLLIDLYGWFESFEIPIITRFKDLIGYLNLGSS